MHIICMWSSPYFSTRPVNNAYHMHVVITILLHQTCKQCISYACGHHHTSPPDLQTMISYACGHHHTSPPDLQTMYIICMWSSPYFSTRPVNNAYHMHVVITILLHQTCKQCISYACGHHHTSPPDLQTMHIICMWSSPYFSTRPANNDIICMWSSPYFSTSPANNVYHMHVVITILLHQTCKQCISYACGHHHTSPPDLQTMYIICMWSSPYFSTRPANNVYHMHVVITILLHQTCKQCISYTCGHHHTSPPALQTMISYACGHHHPGHHDLKMLELTVLHQTCKQCISYACGHHQTGHHDLKMLELTELHQTCKMQIHCSA